MNTELQALKNKWYIFAWNEFYKWNNKVKTFENKDFIIFTELNQKLWLLWAQWNLKKVESGKAWKAMNTNNLSKKEKYERLEKFSKETIDWKLDYSLRDWTISNIITERWIWKDWKNIWEWLLKKAWFEKTEIKEYREWKLKSENLEGKVKEATRKMEEANLAVWKEYKEWIDKAKTIRDNYTMIELLNISFPKLWNELILKLDKAIIKDNFNILPKTEKWELI